jgi:putative endonuclease
MTLQTLRLHPPPLLETYGDIRTAIAREKQLKSWRRQRKLDLIRTTNPDFKDLAEKLGWHLITKHERTKP